MKLFLCPFLPILATLVLSSLSRGEDQTPWQGFILMGSRYQFYTGTFRERQGITFTQIELATWNNHSILIGLDEDDSGDPSPADLVIEYSQLSQNGIINNLLSEEGCHHIKMCAGRYPVHYLLSYSFHRLLKRIVLSGKSVNVHLINPLSPDNSADFHLMLSQTGNRYSVIAYPISNGGLIQFTNSPMLFHYESASNWNYYIDPYLITPEARLLFFRYRLFELADSLVTTMLLSLLVRKQSVPNH